MAKEATKVPVESPAAKERGVAKEAKKVPIESPAAKERGVAKEVTKAPPTTKKGVAKEATKVSSTAKERGVAKEAKAPKASPGVGEKKYQGPTAEYLTSYDGPALGRVRLWEVVGSK